MNSPIKCLLLDDEIPGLSYLKVVCGEIEGLEVVKAFNDPQTFLDEISRLDFDLCILDIEMPGMTGLEIAARLKDKKVIFTTAYKEYASDAFDLNAVDYIRKPIQKDRLQQAIEKAARLIATEKQSRSFVTLNTDRGKSLLYFDQIFYIKTSDIDSRDKTVVMQDKSSLTLKNISFQKLLELLPASDFLRVNKKEMIRLATIQSYTFQDLVVKSSSGQELTLQLSELYRDEFLRQLRR